MVTYEDGASTPSHKLTVGGPASTVGCSIKFRVIVSTVEELQFNGFLEAVNVSVTVPSS